MAWLPDGENIEGRFIPFDTIYERDGRTGGHTGALKMQDKTLQDRTMTDKRSTMSE